MSDPRDAAASNSGFGSAALTGDHAEVLIAELLFHVDQVAASAELQASTIPGGSPTLGLGLVSLLLSEQWRPKRTETITLRRIDWAETRLACELDVVEAMAMTTATRLGDDVWLPLFRLEAGVTPPSVVVDDKAARLAVMSSGECASHIAAGLAQVLGSGVFREAFASQSAGGTMDELDSQRRRTSVNFLLREAVLRILLEHWNTAGSSDDWAALKIRPGYAAQRRAKRSKEIVCNCCGAFSTATTETRRAYGLSRFLLHHAGHQWIESHRKLSTQSLKALKRLRTPGSGVVPEKVLDTGLGTLAEVSRGPIIAALVPREQRRVTVEAVLPPRWFTQSAPEGRADGAAEISDGATAGPPRRTVRASAREFLREQLVPATVRCDIKLRGLRLYQTVEVQVEVEDGLTISDDSGLTVSLQQSRRLALRSADGSELSQSAGDGMNDAADPNGPHPRPELEQSVRNLEQLLDAASDPRTPVVGQRALLNRIGAHAAQLADVVAASEVGGPTSTSAGSGRTEPDVAAAAADQLDASKSDGVSVADAGQVVGDLRDLSAKCFSEAESPSSTSAGDLRDLAATAREVTASVAADARVMTFTDNDKRTGVFRREIGPFDSPDRFIRPLDADGRMRVKMDNTLADALRHQVDVVTMGIAALLFGALAFVGASPSADAMVSVLLFVPAALVVFQGIGSAPTVRARLERPYRNWQLVALIPAGVLALATAGLAGSDDMAKTWVLAAIALTTALAALCIASVAHWLLGERYGEALDGKNRRRIPSWMGMTASSLDLFSRLVLDGRGRQPHKGPTDAMWPDASAAWLDLAAFEPGVPHFDELRQIGHTAGDAAGRLQRPGINVVAVRGDTLGPDAIGGGLAICRSGAIRPTSVFMVRFGDDAYEFVSGKADRKTPTTEQLKAKLEPAVKGDDTSVLLLRTLSSASDAPIYGAGQLSESWLEWDVDGADNGVEGDGEATKRCKSAAKIVRDVAALSWAYQGPMSYFHLMSWENGHLFTRAGAFLYPRWRVSESAWAPRRSAVRRPGRGAGSTQAEERATAIALVCSTDVHGSL